MKHTIRLASIWLFFVLAGYGYYSEANTDVGQTSDSQPASELEKAEIEVRRSEKLLRTLIDKSANGIIRFRWQEDDDGEKVLRCIFVNPAAVRFLGSKADALIDREASEIIRLATSGTERQFADDIVHRFEVAVSRGDTLDVEVKQRSGEVDRWYRLIVEPVGQDFATTLVDITEKKVGEQLREKELKDRIRELEERVRELEGKQ